MNYARWIQLRGPMVSRAPEDDNGGADTQTSADENAGDVSGGTGGDETGDTGGEDTKAATDAGDDDAGGEGDDDLGETQTQRTPWHVKRIAKVTARLSDAEAEAQRLREENEALKALTGRDEEDPKPTTKPGARVYTEDEFQAEAQRRAQVTTLNEKIDVVYDKALALDPKFAERIPQLREAVGDELAKRPDFFRALVKLENGAEVMNALSMDLDRLSELLDGDAVDMALALAKLDTSVKKKPATGGVPPPSRAGATTPPVETINQSTTAEPDLETVSEEEYSAIRARQRAQRAEARGGW
jgi:hypothetical protein